MNVYEKLQTARVRLQSTAIQKTGENKFAGYFYFELGDFLPEINTIFADLKLFSAISFTNELATLTIINSEKPDEQIIFTSPMAEATLKGCHPIQNLGASETYSRRYLYTTALEIVEQDALDRTTGKDRAETPKQNAPAAQQTTGSPASEKQLKMIDAKAAAVARKHSTTKESVIKKFGIENTNGLTSKQAAAMIDKLMELEK